MDGLLMKWKQISKGEFPDEGKEESVPVLVANEFEIMLLVYNGYYKVWDDADGDDFLYKLDKFDYWCHLPENPLKEKKDEEIL